MKKVLLLIILNLLFQKTFAEEKYQLLLNWKPEPQFGGFYEAQSAGIFKKNNLNIEILPGGSGTPTIQMLGNKKASFGIVSAEEIVLFNAKNTQDQVVAIFATYQKNPQVIISKSERDITNLSQLFDSEGILSVQSGLLYFQFLEKKFPNKKVKVVPYLGGISGLISQKNFAQQGFLTFEPLLAQKAGIKTKTFLIAEEGFNPYTTVLATHKDNLKNKDLIRHMYQSVKEGWIRYLKDPKSTNILMQKLNPSLSLEDFSKSAELQSDLIVFKNELNKVGQMNEKRWSELIDQIYTLKFIDKKIPASSCYLKLE